MANNTNWVTRDWFAIIAFFGILTVLTLVTIIYAKEAEQEARELRGEVKALNIPAQNRCIVQTVLSYPPPVSPDEFDIVIRDFDACLQRGLSR